MTTSKSSAGDTPPAFDQFDDARDKSGAGKYPNYWIRKTRSGHCFIFDDSDGAEHITLQHRSGSMMQFHFDGASIRVTHNGHQDITYGEHRTWVSGAHDTSVLGDQSLKVHKNQNVTVAGNRNDTVGANYGFAAGTENKVIGGHSHVTAESVSHKSSHGYDVSTGGALNMTSGYGTSIGSATDAVGIRAQTQLGLKGGSHAVIEADTDTSVTAGGKVLIGGDGGVYINCSGNKAKQVSQVLTFSKPPQPTDYSELLTKSIGYTGGGLKGKV